ncbi:MAG: Fe-S cluster assembly protein SufD [Chitinophagaceae bacterium]|nr:Fe-S cluster assembly protein SufD [Chitinophagaceae bacterium]
MNTKEYFKEQFEQSNVQDRNNLLDVVRRQAFDTFSKLGIPGAKHEEWKYTRISGLFNKEYSFGVNLTQDPLTQADIDAIRLPGHESANELIFINGRFSAQLSIVRSSQLIVLPLEEAARGEYRQLVEKHLGHSSKYQKDGINALNTAFVQAGIFICVEKGQVPDHPVFIYNVADAKAVNVLSQPRTLVCIGEAAQVQIVETFSTLGSQESFTNQVMEIIVEKDAFVEYYKIQNDKANAHQVSTTHIRQIGKSHTHAVTISLNGGMVRNNLNVVLEAAHCEAHLYGLYFQQGSGHIDNHTVVDNVEPNCLSFELYKGIMDDASTGVFNGKIFVQPQAQKTNAYQSNKNVLLSREASVNTKPQLEIFADDVKCSHGCTVGQLDEEGLFYLRSRGIPEKRAWSLLLQGFTMDILEKIKSPAIRTYVDGLIAERLEFRSHGQQEID